MRLMLGRSRSTITLRRGGIDEITVVDDGCGMSADDMMLAVKRHATSKLPDDSLRSYQFTGISRRSVALYWGGFTLVAYFDCKDFAHAWRVVVDGGRVSDPEPAALAKGSMISVTQLFKVVPARLKFLKTERTEQGQCLDIVRRLALAWQSVGFHLKADDRVMLDLPACLRTSWFANAH